MNRFIRLILMGILLVAPACAEKPMAPKVALPVPEEVASESAAWDRAEKLFQAKAYDQALDAYTVFMAHFPVSPHNDAALMKIGAAGRLSGNDEAACRAYSRLADNYPDSLFLSDALIEGLVCLYTDGRFGDVVEKAADLWEKLALPEQKARLETLLGDTCVAMANPVDGFYYYAAAVESVKGAPDQDLLEKLKKTAGHLETPEIRSLLYRLENDVSARGYLLYQLGLHGIADGKEDSALAALSELAERFPRHEQAADAALLMEKINRLAGYQPNRVGCLLPLTGPYKSYGERALRGIELAVSMAGETSNAILPHLIIKDSGSDPEKAVAAVQALAEEGVAAIIGPMAMADAASRQAQLRHVPIIVFSQKHQITGNGDYVFRNFLTSEMQVNALTDYAFDRLGIKKVAILYPDEKYGSTFLQLFWDAVLSHGGQVVGVEAYTPRQTDFADAIKKLAGLYYVPSGLLKEELKQYALIEEEKKRFTETFDGPGILTNMAAAWAPGNIFDFGAPLFPDDGQNPAGSYLDRDAIKDEEPRAIVDFDAVFIPDAPNTAGLIIPQLAFYDIKDVYLLGTNLWHSEHLIKMAGDFLQNFAVFADGFFENRDSEAVKQFTRAFQKAFKSHPGFIEAVAYDTARMVFGLLAPCQPCLRNDIRDRLLAVSGFNGVTGPTAFDKNGEAVRTPCLLTIKGRGFKLLDGNEKN